LMSIFFHVFCCIHLFNHHRYCFSYARLFAFNSKPLNFDILS
jgi:hypothetical protein